jgi:preprotein translocase subunit SecD
MVRFEISPQYLPEMPIRSMKIPSSFLALFAIVATVLAAEAELIRFSAVSSEATPTTKEMAYESRGETQRLFVEAAPIVTERDIARVERVGGSSTAIKIVLTESGENIFNEGIKDREGKRIAVIIGNKVVSAPVLAATAFGRELVIDGNLTTEEADSLVSSFAKINR